MSAGAGPTRGRLQATTDRAKALAQYQALRRTGGVVKALVVAEMRDGSFHILCQEMRPSEAAPLLRATVEALAQVDADRKVVRLVSREEPAVPGEHNRSRPRRPEITRDAKGTLVPPPGENFISCGECQHPLWHVLHHDATDVQSRIACSHCGNEVAHVRLDHEPGRA